MSTFTAVDLSRLPAPAVVEPLDFETILGDLVAGLRTVMAAQGGLQEFDALVESDPAMKLLQVVAYRELQLRQRVNDAARAVMLAYAVGSDLDHLGALFHVTRYEQDPGDPARGVAPTMESDADFRRRIQLSPEGFSVAGPEGAYIFHALNADAQVLDASATSPQPDDIRALVLGVLADHGAAPELVSAMTSALDAASWPGDVFVSVLSRLGDGMPDSALLARVAAALRVDRVRPLTDHVIVQPAEIVPYQVAARIFTFAGPDSSLVLAESLKNLRAYVAECHRLGRDVPRSGIYSALHTEGVQRVELDQPAQSISIARTQAAYCTGINVTHGGVDE